jgi:hypothetical protein
MGEAMPAALLGRSNTVNFSVIATALSLQSKDDYALTIDDT